jgi:cell division protein FtsI/penicillin-binding protein 2
MNNPSKKQQLTPSLESTNTRIRIITYTFIFIASILVLRLAQLQILQKGHYEEKAKTLTQKRIITTPQRGLILDRNDETLVNNNLSLAGRKQERTYPFGGLASVIVGKLNKSGKGQLGLERYFDKELYGSDGWAYLIKDVKSHIRNEFNFSQDNSKPGKSITLSLDRKIQEITELALKKAVRRLKPEKATAIVMNPHTGEILGMASAPSYDNTIASSPKAGNTNNNAIFMAYEPGSTFKMITAAAALEESKVEPREKLRVYNGKLSFCLIDKKVKGKNKKITSFGDPCEKKPIIYKTRDHGKKRVFLEFEDAFTESSNIYFAQLGGKLGRRQFYKYIRNFGFISKTGIELPNEGSSRIKPTSKWEGTTPYAMGFGHALMITPLQLASAYSVIANGGNLLKPTILKSNKLKSSIIRRVISNETAYKLRQMSKEVIEHKHGTAHNLKSDILELGGKTGTAEKVLKGGGYDRENSVCSFAGFIPATEPQFVVVVVVDAPEIDRSGAKSAGPVFKEIAEKMFITPGIFDVPLPSPDNINTFKLASLTGMKATSAVKIAKSKGLKVLLRGSTKGIVKHQNPIATTMMLQGDSLYIISEFDNSMPDLEGLPVKEALKMLELKSLQGRFSGRGLVTSQSPKAGNPIKIGQEVQIHLEKKS